MAETLDVTQLLANQYEPKRLFRWILEIDGIDAFTLKTTARPKREFEETVIDYINQKRYLAGKGAWEPMQVAIYDPISPSAAQKVEAWVRLVHDAPTGRMGYSDFYKKNFSLKMLDGVGNVVEKWQIIGGWPKSIDYGDLDMANSEAAMVTFTLRYDEARLEF